jgi:hypothetical protein
MELVKLPVPVPLVVLLLAVVGVELVLQQTPRTVTVDPPSEVMVPPLCTVVDAIMATEAVVTEGTSVAGPVGLSFEQDKNISKDVAKSPIRDRTYFRITTPINQ